MDAHFDLTPKVSNKKLNILPTHEEKVLSPVVGPGRFPSWLHRKLPKGSDLLKLGSVLTQNRLHTVCEEAKCPNLFECWSKGTATFLVMGKECTRNCGFCDIDFSKNPKSLESDEKFRVADSIEQLKLKHVVITMVARDDLEDGGARHLVEMVEEIRNRVKDITIELLTSDFLGNKAVWDKVLQVAPEIFNHNVETVRSLTPRVRHTATYDRSLSLLKYASDFKKSKIKSGIMVGLGETEEEVFETLRDLKNAGVQIVTIGQYLQPNKKKLLVKSFVTLEQFKKYELYGKSIGIEKMFCGPFVRSSYHAGEIYGK